jgi:hypothetical protein
LFSRHDELCILCPDVTSILGRVLDFLASNMVQLCVLGIKGVVFWQDFEKLEKVWACDCYKQINALLIERHHET